MNASKHQEAWEERYREATKITTEMQKGLLGRAGLKTRSGVERLAFLSATTMLFNGLKGLRYCRTLALEFNVLKSLLQSFGRRLSAMYLG